MRRLALGPLLVLLLWAPSRAEQVQFPLTVDYEVLRIALRAHLERSQGRLELWKTADGCGSLAMRDVTVGPAGDGRLALGGAGEARAGIPFLGLCWANVSWRGRVSMVAAPVLGPDWQLRLANVETTLGDPARGTSRVAARLVSVARRWSESEVSSFAFDLSPPVSEVASLLTALAGQTAAAPLIAAIQQMRPAGLGADGDAIRAWVVLNVPPAAPQPRAPAPALSPAQVRQWEARLEQWDGFLSFVVKSLAGDGADPPLRDELLSLLLEARREVVASLARGPSTGADPVRAVFVRTWDRLRELVRRTAVRQERDPANALRYVVFLSAGDALIAIDAAAPAAGLGLSADGLRRLALSLEPRFTGDPLEYSEAADPRLQQLFRFRDPDAPPRRPRRKVPGTTWQWLLPRPAHAAAGDEEWRSLARRLDRWVPEDGDIADYRATIERLLALAAERAMDPDALEERYDRLFVHLVKATAWQESCWRQFVRRDGRVTYLASSTGDVGLMQVNVRVWRGFFDGTRLRWNAAYNAGAGAEILQQLLVRYGVREGRVRLENAARASYSAYHGGPARYTRYRAADVASRWGSIDRAFWQKYQAIVAGARDEQVLCLERLTTS